MIKIHGDCGKDMAGNLRTMGLPDDWIRETGTVNKKKPEVRSKDASQGKKKAHTRSC